FYNENPEMAVFPTPVIGMLGLIEDLENHRMTPEFKSDSDLIYYVGADRKGLGASEYLHSVHDLTTGDAPELDLEFEAKLQSALLDAIQNKKVNAAHDISDGGLARSEEHTSELQSRFDLVCRLLLEKKKKTLMVCR